ncbi:TIGR02679 family protein [Microbacterium album]|uniref:TIGR02679 family protein n=1 Tax=Microbacterium album TaxID=2053191 RepID=A0A917II40_9MICO|nr:TIGR02679 family protein [Microbacterium album]GGH48312.1 hypothetical protein GCM10010921_25670 [Microbacterium album]
MSGSGPQDMSGLERLLGGPDIAWLVERVRGRILAAGSTPLSGKVELKNPTREQRAAVTRLIGAPRRAGSSTLRVDLGRVEEVLRRGPWPAGLADAVETLTGPVVDRAAVRARESAAWAAARDSLADAAARFPGLFTRWESWCASGGLKRAARSEAARLSVPPSPSVGSELVRQLASVLGALPTGGEPLPVFARRVLGDAHGLDAGRPLGRLAVTALAWALTPSAPDRSPSARDVWEAAGVVMSAVASSVLCLGVPGAPVVSRESPRQAQSATARMLEAMRAARMPLLLTLDHVRSGGVRPLAAERVVHVCENPTLVEVAAERWRHAPDATAPVLVCTSGQPSTAAVELLLALTAEGAACRYHGDFDWAGLRIAESLRGRVPWRPWRYRAEDYRDAVARDAPSLRLSGPPATSPWDPALATAMAEHGLAIEEEAIAAQLTEDLIS